MEKTQHIVRTRRRAWWHRLVGWPVIYPVRALVVAVAVCLLAVLAVMRLEPDPTLDAMFPEHDPASQSLLHIMRTFSAAEEMLVLASAPEGVPAEPQKLLAFASRLEQAVAASPEASQLANGISYRVDAQMRRFFEKELVPAGMFYLSDEQFALARQRLTLSGMQEQIARNEAILAMPGPAGAALGKVAMQDPLRLHEFILDRLIGSRPFATYQNGEAFITPDGRALLIRVSGRQPPSDIEYSKQFTRCISEVAASVNSDGLHLEYAGSYPIATASEKAIRADMVASITGSVILLQVLFLLMYRRALRLFAMAIAPVAMGVLLGFAGNSLVTTDLTPMTAAIGAILAGLAIDYSVYVISDYEAHRRMGLGRRRAALRTMQTITPAVFAAWFTSAIGFAAIGYSSIPGIRDFARIGCLGLTGAFASAVLLLPMALAYTDRRRHVEAASRSNVRWRTLPVLLLINRFRWWCIAGSVLLVIGSAVVLLRSHEGILPLEQDLTVMHPHPNPPLEAQRHLAERFGTAPDALLVHLTADSPQQLVQLSHAARNALADPAVRHQAGITGTFGLADLLPDPAVAARRASAVQDVDPAKVLADFDTATQDSSLTPEAYRPYKEFLQTMLGNRHVPALADLLQYPSLARNLLPASALEGKELPTEAITLVFVNRTLDSQADRAAAVLTIRKALSGLPGATLTGMGVVGYDTEAIIHHDLPGLVCIAAAAVGLYLLLHFRSLRAALLAVTPMVLGLLVLLAAGRLVDQRLNLVNLIAAPLLIGVDVDYGIFLVSVAASRRGFTRRELAQRIDTSLYAVLVCASAALLGFGSLYYTSVPAVQSLGFCVAVGLIASLIFTLLLRLPMLFAAARPDPDEQRPPR